MKLITALVIGLLLCVCSSAVVFADTANAAVPVRPDSNAIPTVTEVAKTNPVVAMETIPERPPEVILKADTGSGKVNPVVASLPGYTQWDIYWTTASLIKPDSYSNANDINYLYYGQGTTDIGVKGGRNCWILIPFTNTITHSGAHPFTRWLFINFATSDTYPSSKFYGTEVKVYNGADYKASYYPAAQFMSGGLYLYYCDMGSYKEYDRGLQATLIMQNYEVSGGPTHYIYLAGAGQKAEW